MAFRKKTLRTMSPTARKVARLTGEIESATNRLKNLIPELQRLDLDAGALNTAKGEKLETLKEVMAYVLTFQSFPAILEIRSWLRERINILES